MNFGPLQIPPPGSRSLDAVGIGAATIDTLIRVDAIPPHTASPVISDIGLDGGGPVATAVVAASRLGLKTGFIGLAGSDPAGRCKIRMLDDEGVDTSRVVWRDDAPERPMLCWVREKDGERAFASANAKGFAPLRMDEVDRDYICGARSLHLDGAAGPGVSVRAAAWIREAGGVTMFDGGPWSLANAMRPVIPHINLLVVAEGTIEAATGCADWREGARQVHAMGPALIVETRGSNGCFTSAAGGTFHTPAFPVHAVDTTGAGDVFHGAYLTAVLNGWDLRFAALFASAVAAMKCTRLGGRAGIPTMQATMNFLQQQHIEPPTH
jgi:sulfofructose kinase